MPDGGRIIRVFITLAVAGLTATCKASPTTPGSTTGLTVTSVSVSATPNPAKLPGTVQVSATVLPAGASQNVTWSSSDPSRATVDASGLVTTLITGSVTITATSTAGPTKSGECRWGRALAGQGRTSEGVRLLEAAAEAIRAAPATQDVYELECFEALVRVLDPASDGPTIRAYQAGIAELSGENASG